MTLIAPDRHYTKPLLIAASVAMNFGLVALIGSLLYQNINKAVPLIESCTAVEVKRSVP